MEWREKGQTFPLIHGASQLTKRNVNTHVYNFGFPLWRLHKYCECE